jgi:hypothetical protein
MNSNSTPKVDLPEALVVVDMFSCCCLIVDRFLCLFSGNQVDNMSMIPSKGYLYNNFIGGSIPAQCVEREFTVFEDKELHQWSKKKSCSFTATQRTCQRRTSCLFVALFIQQGCSLSLGSLGLRGISGILWR